MAAARPLPRLDNDNRFFWTGGADGRLRLLQCQDCRTFVHPPRPVCRNCLSERVEPTEVAGTGVVDTFTVNHQKFHPAMEVPYVIARVAIDGAPGVILTTNIVGCPVDSVVIGDRVRARFEQHDDVWLPLFEKIAA
ncbi:Zn-ribbon domain-containing OB-fold protein [Sinimarinibacterium flocculans]|uniref:Putative OB-fold protein n=1 Tax=Sinimarinibacterium flocculans TaxID=985250 RepID=A0A318E8J8_9GAMM|nr:OB-fold domain-containing protein [Sinimarinibacterium flocculans]PXV68337.1 putative OB-fold protein [Sinimarinibacterium flocculans]